MPDMGAEARQGPQNEGIQQALGPQTGHEGIPLGRRRTDTVLDNVRMEGLLASSPAHLPMDAIDNAIAQVETQRPIIEKVVISMPGIEQNKPQPLNVAPEITAEESLLRDQASKGQLEGWLNEYNKTPQPQEIAAQQPAAAQKELTFLQWIKRGGPFYKEPQKLATVGIEDANAVPRTEKATNFDDRINRMSGGVADAPLPGVHLPRVSRRGGVATGVVAAGLAALALFGLSQNQGGGGGPLPTPKETAGQGTPTPSPETPSPSATPEPSATESPTVIPTPSASATIEPSPIVDPTPSYPEDEQNWVDNITQPEIRWDVGYGPERFGLIPNLEQDPDLPTYQGVLLDALRLDDGNVIIFVGMEDAAGHRFFIPFRAAYPEGLFSVGRIQNNERDESDIRYEKDPSIPPGIPAIPLDAFYEGFESRYKGSVIYFSQWASAGDTPHPDNPLYVARKIQEKAAEDCFSFTTRMLNGDITTDPNVSDFVNKIPDNFENMPIVHGFVMQEAPNN